MGPISPCMQGDIKRLQRQAARFVLTGDESVNEMLSVLKWPPLQARRKYLRLVLLFNVVNHLLYIPHQYLPSPAMQTILHKIQSCTL